MLLPKGTEPAVWLPGTEQGCKNVTAPAKVAAWSLLVGRMQRQPEAAAGKL